MKNNQISKPSYLMTINPDKFLQKSNYKTAMTIKDRDELNPEMAEIVRKILIKRKKDKKNNINTNNNNNSMIKSRKVDSIKKYFDDNYNRKHGLNKEKYYKLNKTLILDSFQDRNGSEHNNTSFVDDINKTNSNNQKKNIKNNKININSNYSCSRNSKKATKNYGNLQANKNNYDNCRSVQRQNKKSKKLSNSLNYDEFEEYEEYSSKNIQKIKIIRNNQYIVNLNSITIDVDQINKDKNLMDINCSSLEGKLINSNILSPLQESFNNSKKNILIKKNDKNFFDENNDKKPLKTEINETVSTKNENPYETKLLEENIENNIKNKILKLKRKNKKIPKNENNKLLLNKSTEHRNRYTLNKNSNDNNQVNITINNGFFSGNRTNNNKISKTININGNKKQKQKINMNMNINMNKINHKEVINTSIKKDNKQKIKKPLNNKKFNKNTIKNNNVYNNINTNKKICNTKTYRAKIKPSPSHSKNDSNLSTERSLNNKINPKIVINRNKLRNKYSENRSLSKDYFQTDENQKYNINKNNKPSNHFETLSMNISNKNNLVKSDYTKYKKNKKEEKEKEKEKDIKEGKEGKSIEKNSIKINNEINDIEKQNKKNEKKEYPNMAKFIYGKKQNMDKPDEEQIKLSKKRETKAIKKIESLCKKGYSGPGVKKTNQDNFFIYNNFNNNSNYIYLGVCDGHGLFGQDISTYLVNNLPQNMNRNIIEKGIKNLANENITELSTLFQETFVQTNISLNEDERIDSSFSGSTCVSLLFTPTRICCINVGDSRCILGKYDGYEWSSKVLSRDHKPSEPDEMNRIIKSGGKVESFRDKCGNFVGPERVWNKQMDGPGLAMSRSFGDEIGHKIGVVVDPEIMEYFLLKEDKFIILGSDGIWEFLSNNEAVEIVKNYYLENNIEGAIEHLYNEASKRWIMEEEVIDDITIIVIFLS